MKRSELKQRILEAETALAAEEKKFRKAKADLAELLTTKWLIESDFVPGAIIKHFNRSTVCKITRLSFYNKDTGAIIKRPRIFYIVGRKDGTWGEFENQITTVTDFVVIGGVNGQKV